MKHYTIKDLKKLKPGFYWIQADNIRPKINIVRVEKGFYEDYTDINLPYPNTTGVRFNTDWALAYPTMVLCGPLRLPRFRKLP